MLLLHSIIIYVSEKFSRKNIKVNQDDDKIRDEKLQYDVNKKKTVKILGSSSGRFDKYDCLTGEEILTNDQRTKTNQKN